jgi:hypothetical protein
MLKDTIYIKDPRKCVYINENNYCWALKSKCNYLDPLCDYREDDTLSQKEINEGRIIKFRIPYFRLKDDTFSHFSYWGRLNYKGEPDAASFKSPSHSSSHYSKGDQQFSGFKDNGGLEIYEGDIIGSENYRVIVSFYNGAFGFWDKENSIPEFFMLYRYLGDKRVLGHIYDNYVNAKG